MYFGGVDFIFDIYFCIEWCDGDADVNRGCFGASSVVSGQLFVSQTMAKKIAGLDFDLGSGMVLYRAL